MSPYKLLILIVLPIFISCMRSSTTLKNGDLLFFKPQESVMEQAISSSTGEGFVHVAIVEVDEGKCIWVIDATPQKGVGRIPLKKKLSEEKGEDVYVYRLRDTSGLGASVRKAKSLVGKSYDWHFSQDNDQYYCSELVCVCYTRPDSKRIFSNSPMNFLDKDGQLPVFWKELFENLDIPVPQGQDGTNPEDLSHSSELINTGIRP